MPGPETTARGSRGSPEPARASEPRKGRGRSAALFAVLGAALVIATVVAAGRGQLTIVPAEVVGSIAHRVDTGLEWLLARAGLAVDIPLDIGRLPAHPQGENTLWLVRFPRVVLAIIVGAALAVAGALMQGVFGNPLAEPAIVGVSPGAAVGASLVFVTGASFLGEWTVPAAAFGTALFATLLVYALSRSGGRTEVVTLILTGVAVTAVAFAIVSFATFIASPDAREQIVFWQLGSLNGARWTAVSAAFPLIAAGLITAIGVTGPLDLLALGDRSARHLGVNVERLRIVVIVTVALLVGAGVAFAGVIGFVGLVVPHLIRMIVGPGHRVLVPASALGGAVLLVTADLVARTAIAYADLPIGMLTALVGGPFFFWLLRRTRTRAGGWA
ncbi:iron ABC transporter permease [Actinobacteria bacterium YIM 96077]|uniref:Iron ABC transporter permease n=1 Tax=Phytoactinopolyspora halophila TaxID=1981511 RepID=A0A329QE80_9ACTN|nr:iron ABC transporter permease [Actinobacteria bacterium YIM 96077]RAW10626.1 iron ABC transporter permease [Phytoactinopolyspora halophila]